MRRTRIAATLAFVALSGIAALTACATGANPLQEATRVIPATQLTPAELAAIEHIREQAADQIALGNTPGAVIVANSRGRTFEFEAFGNKATEPEPVPMTEDTIFDLASVSKVVGTATMAMLLIEDGLMTPETRVADIIPEFAQNDKGDVTIHDLLTHRSGLPAYDNWELAEAMRADGEAHSSALIRRISTLAKRYPTRKYYIYSCLNFLTLANINERVAGETQHSFLTRRVWKPLGMVDTGYHLTPEQIARVAPTFKSLPNGRDRSSIHDPLAHYYRDGQACPGNAGLFSTARDLSIYCEMILNEGERNGVRIMKPETVKLMTTMHGNSPSWRGNAEESRGAVPRAFGWGMYRDAGYSHPSAPPESFIGHTGYTGTYLWLDKHTKSYTVILTNGVYLKDPPQSSGLRRAVTRELIGVSYGDIPQEEQATTGG